MQMGEAQIDGSQLLLASRLDYEAAAKASGSKKAFLGATQHLVENMLESMGHRQEVAMLYGGVGLGTMASASGSGTTRVLTITTAKFAAGIWSGAENACIDVYNSSTKLNTNADVIVTAVDLDARTVSVSNLDLASLNHRTVSRNLYVCSILAIPFNKKPTFSKNKTIFQCFEKIRLTALINHDIVQDAICKLS